MIDLDDVKQRVDLLSICGSDTQLHKVSGTGGGEWAGPCPFCRGKDRFRVQPKQFRWLCRGCADGKWDSVIGYISRRDHLDPHNFRDLQEICRRAIGPAYTVPLASATRVIHEPDPSPPSPQWQQAARHLIQEAEKTLWSPQGKSGLEYLRGRGLNDQTIKKWHLGYVPYSRRETLNEGIFPDDDSIWIPKGIVIPGIIQSHIWYVKFRQIGREPKYLFLKGGHPGLFGADRLNRSPIVLFCEGEFDTILANQESGGMLAACTFGSASNHRALGFWGHFIAHAQHVLSLYDTDEAGQKGALALNGFGMPIYPLQLPNLPGVKDITDFYLNGGDFCLWLMQSIDGLITTWPLTHDCDKSPETSVHFEEKSPHPHTSHRLTKGVE